MKLSIIRVKNPISEFDKTGILNVYDQGARDLYTQKICGNEVDSSILKNRNAIEACFIQGDNIWKAVDTEDNTNPRTILGFCTLGRNLQGLIEFKDLHVLSDFRRLGIGKALLLAGLDYLKLKKEQEVFLTVDITSPASVLYQRLGFKIHEGISKGVKYPFVVMHKVI